MANTNWIATSAAGPMTGAAPAPDNPNSLAVVVDGYTADKKKVRLKATFDPLTGTTKGLHLYGEIPDQSSAVPLKSDGSTPADGTHPLSGAWKPQDLGKYASSPVLIELPVPKAATEDWRIYGNPYSAVNEPALVQYGLAGATPSVVVTVPSSPKGPIGTEYAGLVTGIAISNHSTYTEGGIVKEKLDVTFTPPANDPRWTGVYVETWVKDPASGVYALWSRVLLRKPGTLVYSPTWESVHDAEIRFRSYTDPGTWQPEDDLVNSFVAGFTPTIALTVGTTGGIIDAGQLQPSTLDSTDMQIANGKLAIKNIDLGKALGTSYAGAEFKIVGGQLQVNGVDLAKAISTSISSELQVNGVTGKFEIASLAAAKITAGTLAAGVVYAGSIAASQILAGTLAAGVVYAGTIDAGQVNAGDFTGCTLTLDLGGITTTVANIADTVGGWSGTAGMVVQTNGTNNRAIVSPVGMLLVTPSGTGHGLQVVSESGSWKVGLYASFVSTDSFRTSGGNGVSATVGYNKSGGGTGTLTFSNGILVGST